MRCRENVEGHWENGARCCETGVRRKETVQDAVRFHETLRHAKRPYERHSERACVLHETLGDAKGKERMVGDTVKYCKAA